MVCNYNNTKAIYTNSVINLLFAIKNKFPTSLNTFE